MNQEAPANEPAIDRPPVTADVAPPTVDAEGAPQTRIGRFKLPTATLRAYTMLFALVVIWLFLQWATIDQLHPYGLFLDPVNFSKLLKQTAVTGILAVGMLMIIVAGQIDLSVGSVVGFAGGMAAMTQGWGLLPSLGIAILIGIIIGAIHGSLVAYMNIPAFIVTLGGLLAWRRPLANEGRDGADLTARLPLHWRRFRRARRGHRARRPLNRSSRLFYSEAEQRSPSSWPENFRDGGDPGADSDSFGRHRRLHLYDEHAGRRSHPGLRLSRGHRRFPDAEHNVRPLPLRRRR